MHLGHLVGSQLYLPTWRARGRPRQAEELESQVGLDETATGWEFSGAQGIGSSVLPRKACQF